MASSAGKHVPSEIHITLNVDGLLLYKSARTVFWPILCHLSNIQRNVVFPVVITCGIGKPKDLDLLLDTVDELKALLRNGLFINEKRFTLILMCIVCDAPARSLVKCTKLYSGYYGCDKCNQRGAYTEGKVTFPEHHNVTLRTDKSFRDQENKEHHNGVTHFCQLLIDMITNFPIDYMHQTCLRVTKRLLRLWIRGKRQNRISIQQKNMISERLVQLRHNIPSLFARKPRSLDDIDHWKASEFRQFLLYTGRIVLKDILKPELFKHFLILCTAMRILISKRLNATFNDKASEFLSKFLTDAIELYGAEFMVYNVHNLAHLSIEAKEFGCLDSFSAFPFEN